MKKVGSTILKKGALYDLNNDLVQLKEFGRGTYLSGKRTLTCTFELIATDHTLHPYTSLTAFSFLATGMKCFSLEELQTHHFKKVPKNSIVLYLDRKYRTEKFTELLKD